MDEAKSVPSWLLQSLQTPPLSSPYLDNLNVADVPSSILNLHHNSQTYDPSGLGSFMSSFCSKAESSSAALNEEVKE